MMRAASSSRCSAARRLVAARGARAAAERCGASACSWPACRRSRSCKPAWGVSAGLAAFGLDRRPQRADRLPLGRRRCRSRRQYAAELVALAPDVIARLRHPTVGLVLQATRTIPIVFVAVTDPVGAGFVDSLARPGGNVTGFTRSNTHERQVAGAAQGDCAGRDARGGASGLRNPPGPASSA